MGWLDWLRIWRGETTAPATIPDMLWSDTLTQLPFLGYLTPADKQRLKSTTEQLLHKKPFSGSAGLELSDAMAVLIAAQAALLVLNLSLELYNDLSAVIVTPDAFPIRQHIIDDSGVVHEWEEMLAGEAVDLGGAVLLSWPDIAPADMHQHGDHNVVIHEFAHKIDMGRGGANGYPPFLAGLHTREEFNDWPQAFGAAYEDFCQRVDRIEDGLPADFDPDSPLHADLYDARAADLPLDPYASRDPAEFFAVASEAFFVSPENLAAAYPRIFALLAAYYRQNPLA